MRLAYALPLVCLLAACPDDQPPANPTRVWLGLINGDETQVQLVPYEPDPY